MKTRAGSTANVTLRHHGWNEYLGQDETTAFAQVIRATSREAPVLIAGPTASGKSALAMELAARDGRLIVNADALRVYGSWRVLTARPSEADEAALPHALYGHIARDMAIKRMRQCGLVRLAGPRRQHPPAAVNPQGIGIHDQAAIARGQFHRQRRFATGRRPRDQHRCLARGGTDHLCEGSGFILAQILIPPVMPQRDVRR